MLFSENSKRMTDVPYICQSWSLYRPEVEESLTRNTMSNSKPGFFKRLFGSSKKSGEKTTSPRADGSTSSGRQGSSSESSSTTSPTKMKPSHSPLLAPPVKTRTPSSGSGSSGGLSPTAGASQPAPKPRRQTSGGQRAKTRGQKHRKRTKTLIDPGAIKVSAWRLILSLLSGFWSVFLHVYTVKN